MSNHTRAELDANSLNAVPLDAVGNVLVIGLQAVTFALLDVADAIREQTAALDLGAFHDELADIAHAARKPRA